MRLKLTCNEKIDLLRQTEGSKGIWGDCQFLLNQPIKACDGWVVFDEISQPEKTICDPNKTIFIAGEPSSVHRYNEGFLSQFAAIITPQGNINHPNVIKHHPTFPWYAGIRFTLDGNRATQLTYDDFKTMGDITKTKELSVICSSKTMTSGHRERLAFLDALMAHFGSSLDVFGGGFNYIEDKWEALAPYKYSLVLENSQTEHYWTEKVSDAFLAAVFPFYWGCPNLSDYFPPESYQNVDIRQPQDTIRLISRTIQQDTYEKALYAIRRSRERILDQYNLFPVITNLVQGLPSSKPRKLLIRPEEDFVTSPVRRVGRGVKRLIDRTSSLMTV